MGISSILSRPHQRLRLLGLLFLVGLSGCGQSNTRTGSKPSEEATAPTTVQPDTLCYLQVVGRDSTLLRLIVNDSTVTGQLDVLPFEKDRARGPISGTRTNNQIRAQWQRSGEGVTQPYEVIFTLKGDAVTWPEGERVEKAGHWILKNPGQAYEYVLTKTDCR